MTTPEKKQRVKDAEAKVRVLQRSLEACAEKRVGVGRALQAEKKEHAAALLEAAELRAQNTRLQESLAMHKRDHEEATRAWKNADAANTRLWGEVERIADYLGKCGESAALAATTDLQRGNADASTRLDVRSRTFAHAEGPLRKLLLTRTSESENRTYRQLEPMPCGLCGATEECEHLKRSGGIVSVKAAPCA